ncbi:unnamed protein product [Laminaria digitata]
MKKASPFVGVCLGCWYSWGLPGWRNGPLAWSFGVERTGSCVRPCGEGLSWLSSCCVAACTSLSRECTGFRCIGASGDLYFNIQSRLFVASGCWCQRLTIWDIVLRDMAGRRRD